MTIKLCLTCRDKDTDAKFAPCVRCRNASHWREEEKTMKTVWIVSQGERGEGTTIKGVFDHVKPARERERELKEDNWFDPECDYVIVKEWLVNEEIQ